MMILTIKKELEENELRETRFYDFNFSLLKCTIFTELYFVYLHRLSIY